MRVLKLKGPGAAGCLIGVLLIQILECVHPSQLLHLPHETLDALGGKTPT